MKKYFILYSLLLAVLPSMSQEVLHLQNGAGITIQNGVEVVLQGGIGFDNGSNLVNDGILRLKNNVVANSSDWADNNISLGPLSGTGTVIFNSDYIHHLTGLASFYNLQMNAGGLILNSPIPVSNLLHLIAGKITTGSNYVYLYNDAAGSLLNDASNTGYVNSWINGKLIRQITTNTAVYDFPVGNDTRSNLLQFINNNITGAGTLTALFFETSETDEGLNVSENGVPYISVNGGGIWNLWPNTDATGGNFGLKLYFNGFTGLSDNLYAPLNRTFYSSDAADWQVPAGSVLSPTDGPGRKVSDGYALRTGIADFGQFGIGILNACPDADNDGYTTCDDDCDDTNPNINPGVAEYCNGIDDNCNGEIDEGLFFEQYYKDVDGDGHGDKNDPGISSCSPKAGKVANNDDCDDTNPDIHPGAAELCNGVDDNCNGEIDEGSFNIPFYIDADGDQYGDKNAPPVFSCTRPEGFERNNLDCNDNDASIHPGATEICDGTDNNCDGQTDEGCSTNPTLSINDVIINESSGMATLTITLSHATLLANKISYKTINGSAIGSGKIKDYKSVGNGSLIIPANSTSATINITIYPDNLTEPNEFFDVQVTKATNAVLGDNIGRVTISDQAALITSMRSSTIPVAKTNVAPEESLQLKAYPNPSNSQFTLQVRSSNTKDRIALQVIDVNGRIVETRDNVIPGKPIWIGKRYLQGAYFVRIIQGNEHKEVKLIKLSE